MRRLAEDKPLEAILQSYNAIDQELRALFQVEINVWVQSRSTGEVAQIACNRGYISIATLQAVEGLTILRDLAAHVPSGEAVDEVRAFEFVDLANAVLYAIRQSAPDRDGGR